MYDFVFGLFDSLGLWLLRLKLVLIVIFGCACVFDALRFLRRGEIRLQAIVLLLLLVLFLLAHDIRIQLWQLAFTRLPLLDFFKFFMVFIGDADGEQCRLISFAPDFLQYFIVFADVFISLSHLLVGGFQRRLADQLLEFGVFLCPYKGNRVKRHIDRVADVLLSVLVIPDLAGGIRQAPALALHAVSRHELDCGRRDHVRRAAVDK